jgi:protein-disulfide isomerase
MSRALSGVLLVCVAAGSAAASDRTPSLLKSYVAQVLPLCPAGTLALEPVEGGPSGFTAFAATVRSSDPHCGTRKYVLVSPTTQQVLVGAVIPLPADARPLAQRISAEATKLLKTAVTAYVMPAALPDGLRSVNILRDTQHGPFAYRGFVDNSGEFLIVGVRGDLRSDPADAVREALGLSKATRRGDPAAPLEVVEITDFQCPACARANPKVRALLEPHLSRVNYALVDLPLFEHHEWAVPAALAGRAIRRVAPDKYSQFVQEVFAQQGDVQTRTFSVFFMAFAEEHGINWNKLSAIYNSPLERAAVLNQVSGLFALGISSTPTFIVNGRILGYGPDGSFTLDTIARALNGK